MVRRTFIPKGLLACLLFLIFLNTILSISNIIAYTASQSGPAFSKNEGTAKSRFSCVVPTLRESWIHSAVTFRFRRVERVETSKRTAPEPSDVLAEPLPLSIVNNGRLSIEVSNPYVFSALGISPNQSMEKMIADYQPKGLVEYAAPDYTAYAFFNPNDTYYQYQWNIVSTKEANIRRAWNISTGKGVIVAVLDSGVAYENYRQYRQAPDFASTRFVPGYDFIDNDAHPNDESGHGTHIAGVIAQSTNNHIGTVGVAFDAQIMPVRVLGANDKASYASLIAGIYYAVDHGANVINISAGGMVPSVLLERAVKYAYERGVTVVAAAGNYFLKGNPTTYPAAYDDYVIAVGAVRYDGQRAPYANTGSYIDLVAPGGDLTRDQNRDGYKDGILQQTFVGNPTQFNYYFQEGTSIAAAHVAGVVALLIANGVTHPDDIRTALLSTARGRGRKEWDEAYGFGLVDAYAALMFDGKTAPSPYLSYERITFSR